MRDSMRALLSPASVAIIGDTPGPGRGGWIHAQLRSFGYAGPIYPVNPKYAQIRGERAYAALSAIPDPVEFVAVAVGAAQAVRVMQECVEKHVRAALFVAGGFAESGREGRAIQDEIQKLALAHDIAVCGPNCYGIANLHGRFAAYGGALTDGMRPGATALLFQSGALTHSVTDPLAARGSGYSYIITTGNEAVITLADYVDALADDPHTRVIACFAEGFASPERFFDAARRAIAHGKRVVVLKTGRSELARQAALTHTGALTGPDAIYDALFRQLGIARVADLDELIETAELLSLAAPAPIGAPVIVSISGGSCGIAADLADQLGLALAPMSATAAAHLRTILPAFATPQNPLDLTGAAGENPLLLPQALAALTDDPQINAVALALNTPLGGDPANQALYQAMSSAFAVSATASDKLHVIFSMSSGQFDPAIIRIARENGVPLLQGMRESLAALAHWQRFRDARLADPETLAGAALAESCRLVEEASDTSLSEQRSKAVLAAAGIPITRELLASIPQAATQAAAQIGYPVALKIASPDIAHKTEIGGVQLDLTNTESVTAAFSTIIERARSAAPTARIDGILVQEMVGGGAEMLIGVTNHPGLGPILLFGLGGTLAEALGDVSLRAAPIDAAQADAMIAETKAGAILAGWRGAPPLDRPALVETLVQVGRLAWQLRDVIAAIDINPLVVLPAGQGVRAVDALIVRRSSEF